MSPVTRKIALTCLLIAGLVMAAGCGDPNSRSNFDPDASKHQAGWLPAGHMNAARVDISSCQSCHGPELDGGIAGVSCTTCHLGGALSMHPAAWAGTILRSHGPFVVANGSDSCKNVYCHGSTLLGVTGSGPSCSSCHSYP
jgi:hypothetical protein